jgi:hypothetical protein
MRNVQRAAWLLSRSIGCGRFESEAQPTEASIAHASVTLDAESAASFRTEAQESGRRVTGQSGNECCSAIAARRALKQPSGVGLMLGALTD